MSGDHGPVNKKKISCFAWLIVFLALAGASGWFVGRRIPEAEAALIGGFVGGVIFVIAISLILSIAIRIKEWWFLIRTQFGGEPEDPDAKVRSHHLQRQALEELTLRTGTSYGLRAAGRIVKTTIAAVIFTAIAIVIVAGFCTIFPLEAAEPEWWEVDLERYIDRKLRTPLVTSGVVSTRGYRLQTLCEGCANGRLEIGGNTIDLEHATYRGGRAVHLSATPDDRDGVTLDGDRVVITRNGKPVDVPPSWLQPNDIQTALSENGEYEGRVTVIAPDGWIRCRASFHTRVDPKAWLR